MIYAVLGMVVLAMEPLVNGGVSVYERLGSRNSTSHSTHAPDGLCRVRIFIAVLVFAALL